MRTALSELHRLLRLHYITPRTRWTLRAQPAADPDDTGSDDPPVRWMVGPSYNRFKRWSPHKRRVNRPMTPMVGSRRSFDATPLL